MPILLQDIIVTIVSFSAAVVLVRRVVSVAGARRDKPECGACTGCSPTSRRAG